MGLKNLKPVKTNKKSIDNKQMELDKLIQTYYQRRWEWLKLIMKRYLLLKPELRTEIADHQKKLEDLNKEIRHIKQDIKSIEKGTQGELLVQNTLAEWLPEDYVLINNYKLATSSTRYEIDHVVTGPKGVFLIETKTMKGRIFMEDQEEYWFKTPVNNPDAIKTPVKNPQLQLIRAREVFQSKVISGGKVESDFPLHLAVVFPRGSSLLVNREKDFKVPVLYHDEIPAYIETFPDVLIGETLQQVTAQIFDNNKKNPQDPTKSQFNS